MLTVMTGANLHYLIKSLQQPSEIGAISCSTLKKRNVKFRDVCNFIGLHKSKWWLKGLNIALWPQNYALTLYAIQLPATETAGNWKF